MHYNTINFIINASFGTGRGEKASMTEPYVFRATG